MEKSKANIRLIRECMGMTQQEIADTFGVQLRSARRWEEPQASENNMPDEFWGRLLTMFEYFKIEAEESAQALLDFAEENDKEHAIVAYYRNQDDLDSRQNMEHPRKVGYVNALTREAAMMCMSAGLDITAQYWRSDSEDKTFVLIR